MSGMGMQRRNAIADIKTEDLPQNQPNPVRERGVAISGSTFSAQSASSPVRRNLFGTPDESKRLILPQSPLVTAPPSTSVSTGLFGTSSSVGLGGSGSSIGQTIAKSPVSTKMAAFKSGIFGSNTLSSTSATGSAPVVSNSSFLAPAPTSLALSASRPTFLSAGGSTPFGASNPTTTGTSLFGATASKPTGGLFGSTTSSSLGGLGATQQQQQPVQQQVIQQYHPFVKACGDPQITGNDNDKLIAQLNQVAASLGVGKAPYKDGNQIQTFKMEGNCFEKFVGIGYNKVSDRSDDDGFVTLVLRHPMDNLNTPERRGKILEVIKAILGNPNNVEILYAPGTTMRPLPDGHTEICIIAKEAGFVCSACKLHQALQDGPKMTQLESQLNVDRSKVLPKVGMTKAQRDRYLETLPDGIDERIWQQAIRENPAPNKLLPVAVRGWEALRDRQKAQVFETETYQKAMKALENEVETVASEHARALVAMEQVRNRHKQLSYRLIRIMLAQWITARYSRQIDTDEDVIEAKCDTLLAQMNRNHQVKFFVDKFYEVLETKPDKLRESMWKMFDMALEDEHYARVVLTEFVYICEGLIATSNLQVDELEACRRTLEG